MPEVDALLAPRVLREIERAAGRHLGMDFRCTRVTDLADRSSHPAALLHGPAATIFAKLLVASNAAAQAQAELSGLALLRARAGVRTPQPVGDGHVDLGWATVVLLEAVAERSPAERTRGDWAAIGRTLAAIHRVRGNEFGLDHDGFFGPLPQDNRPTAAGSWADFYAERRVLPWLRQAVDSHRVSAELARRVETLMGRLDAVAGAEPAPTLLHGDAQHHNFVSTDGGAVVIDASPCYGHPELDLALVDYFAPVPPEVFAGYREIAPIDPGFEERRELWRLFAYLGILAVDGGSTWGAAFADRLTAAVSRYG